MSASPPIMVSRSNRESVGVWFRYLQLRPSDAAQVRSGAVHTVSLLTQSRGKLWHGFPYPAVRAPDGDKSPEEEHCGEPPPRMLVCPEREGLEEDVRPLYGRAFKSPKGSLLVLSILLPRVDAAGRDPGASKQLPRRTVRWKSGETHGGCRRSST